MDLILSTDGAARPRALLHDAGDVNRLILHLFTHWTLPRVEIRIDALPPLVVQLAQHRIARLSARCNCLIAGLLAATTLLGGSYFVWTLDLGSRTLIGVAVASLYAGLIGKGIDVAWTRARIMLVLRRLRHRLVAGETVETGADEHAQARSALYMGRKPPRLSAEIHAAVETADVAHDHALRPVSPRLARPRILLRDATDVNRLILHLFTRWTLPRVEINVDGLPALDVQRAQHRIASLSERCNCLLAMSLAGMTILGGTFYVQWTSSQNWQWMSKESWGPLGLVPVAALGAGLTGWAIEVMWTRISLMLVLLGVRHR